MWDIPFQRTVRERQPAAPKGVLGAIHRPAPRFVYRTVQPLQIGPVCTSTAAGIVLFCSCLLEHAWCRAVRKRLLFLGVLGGGGVPFGVPCRSHRRTQPLAGNSGLPGSSSEPARVQFVGLLLAGTVVDTSFSPWWLVAAPAGEPVSGVETFLH